MRCPQAACREAERERRRARSLRRQAATLAVVAAVMGASAMGLVVMGLVSTVAFVLVQWVSGFTTAAAICRAFDAVEAGRGGAP